MTVVESKPDHMAAIPGDLLRYALAVADAIKAVEAPKDMEADDVPIYWFGEIAGYIAISEADGKTYDWVPVTTGESA